MRNLEQWKDVIGYENLYKISNIGKIKSLPKTVNRGKFGTRYREEITLKQTFTPKGYNRIILRNNNIKKNFFTHRLVAMAFIPNPLSLPQINHINGVKDDNRVENLEWCTNSHNILHAFSTGLKKPTKGTINGMSKLNEAQVLAIRNKDNDMLNSDIAKLYMVNTKTIRNILNRKTWSHI